MTDNDHHARTAIESAIESAMDIAAKLVSGPVLSVSRVAGGRNSRVYRVDTEDNVFALKQYPSLEDDSRDRLGVEASALEWMGRHRLDMVPRLVAIDRDSNSALLSWVDGSQVRQIVASDIDQAVGFLGALEELRGMADFPSYHLASEACLSGAEIERQIRRRVGALHELEQESALQAFLNGEFAGVFEGNLSKARKLLSSAGLSFDVEIANRQRSLVPSDFGFHNALKDEKGRITFVDFEYFGWDDPAKLTADVLLHPGTPVPTELLSRFQTAAEKLYGKDPDFVLRLRALRPLFGLRWVLILLNEFHPERWRRRILAGASSGWAEAKSRQLLAARSMLEKLGA